MAVQRFKISLNQARFPMISAWSTRAALVASLDTSGKSVKSYAGAEENLDYNLPQILYGENFVPVSTGIKSVSYTQKIPPNVVDPVDGVGDFDQIFPLRDAEENTVLFSPAKGANYHYDSAAEEWQGESVDSIFAAIVPAYQVAEDSQNTPETAPVTRAYVDGKTLICYGRIGIRQVTDPPGPATADGSIFVWDSSTQSVVADTVAEVVQNITIPVGETDGIASSNGYLLVWSGLRIYWAPFNGTTFDFDVYANGEVTGAGSQIPEDLQGPITAVIPLSGGYIIFTTKNAVAAFYNANNFASPWIFKGISNAGGVEGFEQVAAEGSAGSVYAYTTGGLQKISLNNAESVFPDVSDFLGGHFIESFDTGLMEFDAGEVTTELFVKLQYCGQRFLVISYGMYPGIYSYCLVYDTGLQRWGKLRLKHKDCFFYSYGTETALLNYNMLEDVTYDDLDGVPYDEAEIEGGALTYPRQSIAFLRDRGEVKIAVLDWRDPTDDSEAFVLVGRIQLSRARLTAIQTLEVDGIESGGSFAVARSTDGKTLQPFESGTVREQTQDFAEVGFDCVTGKNYTLYINGQFSLSDLIVHATVDGSF